MEKTLIIAEKPELGKAVAAAIMPDAKSSGGTIKNDQYCVVWAFGHLLSLKEPEDYDEAYKDRKDVSLLPITFRNWQKKPKPDLTDYKGKVVRDNSYARDRLMLIGNLLKQYPNVINCGDPDDEGQLLIDEILDYFDYHGNVQRVLINDNLPDNIRRQFKHLQPNENFRQIGKAAYARQMADKAFGINYSRLASIRSGSFYTVGRVQSPTLNLVVERDRAIQNHVSRKYYELSCDYVTDGTKLKFRWNPSKETLDGESHVMNRDAAEAAAQSLPEEVDVTFSTSTREIHPPLPYNATELQADMNGRFGYSLSKTIEITQHLRDDFKAITYNRSDCQYLGMEHWAQAKDLLPRVMKNLGREFPVDYSIKSKCFNDSKISAHHGIIPQNTDVDLAAMSREERNVYTAICERYLMQFLPPLTKEVCTGSFKIPSGTMKYSADRVKDKGFTQYFSESENEKTPEPFLEGPHHLTKGEHVITSKNTKPAPKYTPKTLVKDMCGISKYVKDPKIKDILKEKDKDKVGENGSIGTVATRGAIVDNLIKRGFLDMDGKNIVSTEKGQALIDALPPDCKNADVTARWWVKQEEIKEGKADVNDIMNEVADEFNKCKDTAFQGLKKFSSARPALGKCPVCGKEIRKGRSKKTGKPVYFCTGYKEGCDFRIYDTIRFFSDSVNMTDAKVKTLLEGKEIHAQLTSKAGEKYQAKMKLKVGEKDNRHYANLERTGFVNTRRKRESK